MQVIPVEPALWLAPPVPLRRWSTLVSLMLVLASLAVGCSGESADSGVAANAGGPSALASETGGYGPDALYGTEETGRLSAALATEIGDPLAGGACLSVAQAKAASKRVLADLHLSGWSIQVDKYARDDGGCAVPDVVEENQVVNISSAMSPDVGAVLDKFRDLSLNECLSADEATTRLSDALKAAGQHDFTVKQGPYIAGPNDREAEIKQHAKQGCVFYTISGADDSGDPIYYLSGG